MTQWDHPDAMLATAHRGLRSMLATLASVRLRWWVPEDTPSPIIHPTVLMSTHAWSWKRPVGSPGQRTRRISCSESLCGNPETANRVPTHSPDRAPAMHSGPTSASIRANPEG